MSPAASAREGRPARAPDSLDRRFGSWTVPGGVLALMAVVFTFSTVVIGPALTGASDESAAAVEAVSGAPSGPSEHESHQGDERGGAP